MVTRLVESALQANEFQDSFDICSRKKQIVIPFGCDKDIEGTSMLLRVANRVEGNNRDNCQLLAYGVHVDEKHVNLEMTILEEKSTAATLRQARCVQLCRGR
jgi:hypothetical protein